MCNQVSVNLPCTVGRALPFIKLQASAPPCPAFTLSSLELQPSASSQCCTKWVLCPQVDEGAEEDASSSGEGEDEEGGQPGTSGQGACGPRSWWQVQLKDMMGACVDPKAPCVRHSSYVCCFFTARTHAHADACSCSAAFYFLVLNAGGA